MIEWYQTVLEIKVGQLFEEDFACCNLDNGNDVLLGIAEARQMGVEPVSRKNISVVLQFEVKDDKVFFKHLEESGG